MAFLLPKSVFIHIPKTGGQWVAAALQNAGLIVGQLGEVHASPDEIAHESAFRDRSVVFAIVRHPLTWYQSMWTHRMDEGWDDPINDPDWFSPRWIQTWADFNDHCRATTFEDFVRKCARRYPDGWVSMLYDSYTAGCTFIGRQEQLADDLVKVLDLAGETFQADRIRTTRPQNVRSHRPRKLPCCQYTPDLVELVMKAETRAIGKFGYEEIPASISMREGNTAFAGIKDGRDRPGPLQT